MIRPNSRIKRAVYYRQKAYLDAVWWGYNRRGALWYALRRRNSHAVLRQRVGK